MRAAMQRPMRRTPFLRPSNAAPRALRTLLGASLALLTSVAGPGLAAAQPGAAQPGAAPTGAPQPLSANDVSILFPAPTSAADLANLIALKDLNAAAMPTGGRLWSEADFARFLAIAESPAGHVGSSQIRL